MGRIKNAYKVLRSHYWAALVFDAVMIILAFVAINMWQTRDLPDAGHTPVLASVWLDDMKAGSVFEKGKTGVVYFFAPWCFYCRHSIKNLDELVTSGDLAWARAVALDYGTVDEVRDFVHDTGIHLPVLLGGPKASADWRIRGFPSYFVINGEGKIVSRSVGYSTKLGMQSRLWLSKE